MIGDVLTSLAKPLQDAVEAGCYLTIVHPVMLTADRDRVCPDGWVNTYVMPGVVGLPYLMRLLQCARRYYDAREPKHLLNLGKYFTCLVVIAVGAMQKPATTRSTIALVVASTVATLYAAAWDILMDWGADLQQLQLGKAEPVECESLATGGSKNGVSTDSIVRTLSKQLSEAPKLKTALFGRAQRPDLESKRLFSVGVFRACSVLDIITRSTWVLTLLPIHALTSDLILRDIFRTLILTVEIFRRTMWAVLRLEYEQVANAGGFRALLWVPKKVNEGIKPPGVSSVQGHMEQFNLERRASVQAECEPSPNSSGGSSSSLRLPLLRRLQRTFSPTDADVGTWPRRQRRSSAPAVSTREEPLSA
eukprot:NODE_602_length_1452_cov_282.954188.p1 GENE.NODE_602_length_1452_cov_282.954188~~NODE_602_length_1452_cov_282.954188.p1  ORF type:complete len:379 (+),score=92.49 NODE_602_length_1452_cov_282.954188:50-1138(+)